MPYLQAFAIFCGMAIHNTSVYEDVQKAMAKQRVAFEVRFLYGSISILCFIHFYIVNDFMIDTGIII